MLGGVPSLTILGARQFLREDTSGPNIVKGEALPGNVVPEIRDLQAGRHSQERTIARQIAAYRGLAEALRNTAMGGESATPTSDIEGQDEAPIACALRTRRQTG